LHGVRGIRRIWAFSSIVTAAPSPMRAMLPRPWAWSSAGDCRGHLLKREAGLPCTQLGLFLIVQATGVPNQSQHAIRAASTFASGSRMDADLLHCAMALSDCVVDVGYLDPAAVAGKIRLGEGAHRLRGYNAPVR